MVVVTYSHLKITKKHTYTEILSVSILIVE